MVALRSGEPAAVWSPLDLEGSDEPAPQERSSPPLVGRAVQLATLMDQVAAVVGSGIPRLVTVLGEPGIGKTRLLGELAARIAADQRPVAWRQGRSPHYGGVMAFHALAQAVKAEAAILESDSPEQAERKLRHAVDLALRQDGPEATAWVSGQLLRLVGGSQTPAALHLHDDSSEEMLAVWRRFIYALAANRPLALVIEDAQWADAALLDFIESLVDPAVAPPAGAAPLLVLVSARPELVERRPGWGRQRGAGATIRLEPLSDHETGMLLTALLDHHGLPPRVAPELLERAGGNPLFAEEYVRMITDRGPDLTATPGSTLPLPETVHGIIAARLDGMPAAEKAVLYDAAVLGSVGWLGALADIGGRDPVDLDLRLRRLEARELLQLDRNGAASGHARYAFRHVVVRDVAYNQLLRADRVAKHLAAATWLEGAGAELVGERAYLLAHHYRAALELSHASGDQVPGLETRAVTALAHAGDRAAALGLYEGAKRSYMDALRVCAAHDPRRADLLLRLGRARCRGRPPVRTRCSPPARRS
jgi:predicted ATPase